MRALINDSSNLWMPSRARGYVSGPTSLTEFISHRIGGRRVGILSSAIFYIVLLVIASPGSALFAMADERDQIIRENLPNYAEYYKLREKRWYSLAFDHIGDHRMSRIVDSFGRITRRVVGNFLVYSSPRSLEAEIALFTQPKRVLSRRVRAATVRHESVRKLASTILKRQLLQVERLGSLPRRELGICKRALAALT